jgi:hypothetical protein
VCKKWDKLGKFLPALYFVFNGSVIDIGLIIFYVFLRVFPPFFRDLGVFVFLFLTFFGENFRVFLLKNMYHT